MFKNYFKIAVRIHLRHKTFSFINLLSLDFIKLVLIAFLIAAPLCFFTMNKLLENFAYHTAISWWMFALAVSFSLLIAVITISFQSIKAAMAKPVKRFKNRVTYILGLNELK